MIKLKKASVFDYWTDFVRNLELEVEEKRTGIRFMQFMCIITSLSGLSTILFFFHPAGLLLMIPGTGFLGLTILFERDHIIIKRDKREWLKK